MRLNLGCGNDIRPGYVNVDQRRLPGVDRVADLSDMPWPFETETAEEILMLDFLEHFPYEKTRVILMECYRILRPEGELVIQVPDGAHLMAALQQEGYYLCNRCGTSMLIGERGINRSVCVTCGSTADTISEAAMRRLYGGQDFPGNFHFTCFTKKSLLNKTVACGFSFVGLEEESHQHANWNFKARFKRGELW